ncbi:MAG TPA: ATP-binding protein, partial [Patescibacteria group bacterium]|nr:ATP-binding protein [Patescibacteria group bacterium]
VLHNLLSNAISYTNPGGKVTVKIETNPYEVITHITDSGIGIPKEALPRLFTKFFRVSGVLEQGSKGTGLGLYISKAIIEMHHGRIWVQSEEGKGSTFSFAIPIANND